MKVCSKCKVEKDESEFSLCKQNKDGLRGQCKECRSEYIKQYYIENIDEIKNKKKIYNNANRDSIIERNRLYYKNNTEKCNESSKRYRNENLEKSREHARIYGMENRSKANERSLLWYHKNNEKCRELRRKYRNENKDKIKEIGNRYRSHMTDAYIRKLITQGEFESNAIPQDLVDFHREVIRAKRLLKELQK